MSHPFVVPQINGRVERDRQEGNSVSGVLAGLVLAWSASIGNAGSHGGGQPMIGEFVYFADAAIFTQCGTSETVPVSVEGDYLSLETSYLEARVEPQAPVVMVVSGEIADREGMEGGVRQMLVADRFVGVVPGLSCERALAESALEGTYWKLLSLGTERLTLQTDAREAHIILGVEEGRFFATAGCNTILGDFESTPPKVALSPGPMTMMACPPPIDRYETELIKSLEEAASASIVGPTLELQREDGSGLAFFGAVALR